MMTTFKYIILSDSETTISKRFKAIGLKAPEPRTDSMEFTVGGNPDKASGPTLKQWEYVLRVPQDVQDDNSYGNMDDLLALWRLTNPNASPSDVITLTDHYGDSYDCFFMGSLEPEPLTTMLEGVSAWHIVQISLQYIRDHEAS